MPNGGEAEAMKDLIEYIARSMVDNEEEVSVSLVPEGDRIIVRLQVDPRDMGKVIGKEGKIAQAMRTLLKVAATLEGRQAILVISSNS